MLSPFLWGRGGGAGLLATNLRFYNEMLKFEVMTSSYLLPKNGFPAQFQKVFFF